MDAKFSPRVREIMFRSHEEAVKLGNSYIGLEHLFLGIIDGKDNDVANILDELKLETYKTKVVADCLKALGAGKKALIVLEDNNAFAVKSIANIAGAKACQVNTINTYDIINADTLIIVKGAVAKLEEVYA